MLTRMGFGFMVAHRENTVRMPPGRDRYRAQVFVHGEGQSGWTAARRRPAEVSRISPPCSITTVLGPPPPS